MSTPAIVSLGDSNTLATLLAELHALREDVKILLGNQKQSSKLQRNNAVSNDGEVIANISDIKSLNGGMDPMPSAAEEALRDLNIEVKSLKIAMQTDLRTIKESFLAGFQALAPQRSQEPDNLAGAQPTVPSIKDVVAVALQHQHESKVGAAFILPTSLLLPPFSQPARLTQSTLTPPRRPGQFSRVPCDPPCDPLVDTSVVARSALSAPPHELPPRPAPIR